MSQITKKIISTRGAKQNTTLSNLTPATSIEIVVQSDYSRIGWISFHGIDTTYLPDTVTIHLHSVENQTNDAKLYRVLGDWTEDMATDNLPQSEYFTDISGKGWIEITDVPKSYLENGFRLCSPYNIYSSTFHTHRMDGYEPYIEYDTRKPDISDFTVTGELSNVSSAWIQTDCQSWKIEAILNGNVISTKTGTSTTGCVFLNEFSLSGEYEFRLTCYYDDESVTESKIVTLTQISPVITSLEPSNVQMLRTDVVPITFTATNVTNWSLTVKQAGVTKHSASGTNERATNIQANVLSNGSVTITLTCTYAGNGYTTTTTKEVSFIAYGKPESPTLSISSIYNTPKPLLKWVLSSEQVAYRVIINHGEDTISDVSAYGTDSAYQVTDMLLNNNIYSISLYIKNQYDLWSDPVTASFEISFAELEPPVFTIYNDDDNAMNVLVIESPVSEEFYYHEVYRREKDTTTWLKIADNVNRVQTIKDNECRSNTLYEYKVSAVSSLGTYTDSEIKECSCNFHNTHINVANSDQKVILNMEVSSDVTYEDDINFEVYDGINKPGSSSGLLDYATLSISCQLKEADFYKIMAFWKESLLCIRDASGLLLYGRISKPKYSYYLGRYQTSFTFTETYNEEVNMNGNDESRFNCFIESEW